MPKALFVTYGGGHVAMTIPTVQELSRRGWQTTVLGLTTAGKRLADAGIPYIGFRSLLGPDDRRVEQHGLRLVGENHATGTGVPLEESIAYLGLSYADLEDRVGAAEAARQYAARKRHAFLPVGPLKRLLACERPDVVVATSSPRAERAAVLAARELGIPSVVMMDLFGKEWDYLFDPGYGDLTLVFAPTVYEDYLQRGRTSENLALTGNPAFDRLASAELAEEGRRWRAAQGLGNKTVVLWAATNLLTPPHVQEVLAALAECAHRNPNWHVLYRPHPSSAPSPDQVPPGCTLADNRVDVAVHLHAADCVLVTISTCGVEAALLDKPVVKLRFIDPTYRIHSDYYAHMDSMAPYEQMGIAIPVTRLEDLQAAVAAALPGGSQSQALREARRRLPPAGGAAAKVANAVEELVRRHRPTQHAAA